MAQNKRPLVAVTITRMIRQDGVPVHVLTEAYTHALSASGVIPLLVPSTLDTEALRTVYERVDGVVLTGGGDVNPQQYGAQDHCELASDVDEARDNIEVSLAKWAFEQDTPLLGICRGSQVMNVALGGSLIVDIPAQVGSDITHVLPAGTPNRRKEFLHTVKVAPDTRLATIFNKPEVTVNSIHHQAVDQLAPALRPIAFAPDEIIEGVEAPGARFYLGVQWHPEEIYDLSPDMQALFKAFVEAL